MVVCFGVTRFAGECVVVPFPEFRRTLKKRSICRRVPRIWTGNQIVVNIDAPHLPRTKSR